MAENLLIIDCSPSTSAGISLREMLEQTANTRVQFRQESAEGFCRFLQAERRSAAPPAAAPDVVFLVLSCAEQEQLNCIVSFLKNETPGLPIILVHEDCDPGRILEFFQLGIADCIAPPFRPIDVLPRVWRLLEHTRTSRTLVHSLKKKLGLTQLIGESPAFRDVTAKIPMIAPSDVSVHISGETGTGKELCARAIHYLSPRADKPFLPLNCGAIPVDLVENELFGHVRGAFTGATLSHGGLIHEANGGTLLLDEIDCLPLSAQVKLLRFVQEKEYRQLGSAKVRQADVRIIAATNTDLARAVRDGAFREDLFYRLSIVHLALPPLRERPEDIPLLARHFLAECAEELGKQATGFTPAAMRSLTGYSWPGNVRELENVVKRAVIFSQGAEINVDALDLPGAAPSAPPESFRREKTKAIEEFEKRYMQRLLQEYRGNITRAAKAAQKNRRAFWELIRKYHIDVQQFKHPAP